LDRNIHLSTLFWNILCSSHNFRDQISHSNKTTGKINFPYFNFCDFRKQMRRQKTKW
jgi:hypothetical protein